MQGRFPCCFTWHTCTIMNSHIFCWIQKIILVIVIEDIAIVVGDSPILFSASDTIFELHSNTASWITTSYAKKILTSSLLPQEVPKVGGNSCSLLLPPFLLNVQTLCITSWLRPSCFFLHYRCTVITQLFLQGWCKRNMKCPLR